MKEQSIDIIIEENGNVVIETEGFVGEECSAITEKIEKAIGKTENDFLKQDFFKKKINQNRIDFLR